MEVWLLEHRSFLTLSRRLSALFFCCGLVNDSARDRAALLNSTCAARTNADSEGENEDLRCCPDSSLFCYSSKRAPTSYFLTSENLSRLKKVAHPSMAYLQMKMASTQVS